MPAGCRSTKSWSITPPLAEAIERGSPLDTAAQIGGGARAWSSWPRPGWNRRWPGSTTIEEVFYQDLELNPYGAIASRSNAEPSSSLRCSRRPGPATRQLRWQTGAAPSAVPAQIRRRDLTFLLRNLATLLDNGLSLAKALSHLGAGEVAAPLCAGVLDELRRQVEIGRDCSAPRWPHFPRRLPR